MRVRAQANQEMSLLPPGSRCIVDGRPRKSLCTDNSIPRNRKDSFFSLDRSPRSSSDRNDLRPVSTNDHTARARASEPRTGDDNYRAAVIVFRLQLSVANIVAGCHERVVGGVDNVSVWRSWLSIVLSRFPLHISYRPSRGYRGTRTYCPRDVREILPGSRNCDQARHRWGTIVSPMIRGERGTIISSWSTRRLIHGAVAYV